MEMKLYETTPEHALEYGLIAKKPLFLIGNFEINQNIFERVDEYAKNNGNDLVFGHISEHPAFKRGSTETKQSFISLIKYWLHDNGYAVNQENNDFYKLIKILK
jgi:hypothetical protein